MSRALAFIALTAALACGGSVASSRADEFHVLPNPPGTSNGCGPAGMSANGAVYVGSCGFGTIIGGTHSEAVYWTLAGSVSLGFLPGDNGSVASATNADGSVIVGTSIFTSGTFPHQSSQNEAFRWTAGGGMVGLGFLPGGVNSFAYDVSDDGSVVVGYSDGATTEAFRWTQSTGMVGLGFLPGGTISEAYGVSGDGSVIVGKATIHQASDYEAFRWTQATGMVGLGFLPGGNSSQAVATNVDGSVVVGSSIDSTGHNQAFRWTQSTGMVGLGFLPGDFSSSAAAVNADGSVVVGSSSSIAIGQPTGTVSAFIWQAATGMQSVQALLVASGVSMPGWNLTAANGVSADGSVVLGIGTTNGENVSWVARFGPAYGTGLITTDVVSQSFAGQAAMGQTGNAAIGNGLSTFSHFATQTRASQGSRTTPYSVFAYGGYDSDPAASGTFGLTVDLPDAMVAGAAASVNTVRTEMVYDGDATMWGGSLGAFLARVPDAGLQWLVGVNGIMLSGDVTRGYLNGSGAASSHGHTDAVGYGATARIGWTIDNILPKTQVTPFASYTYTNLHVNGYTETGGPFPAQMDSFDASEHTSRLGTDARYTLAPGKWLWGALAWAHRLDGGESPTITGNLIGLFGVGATGASVAQDWAEATAGVRLPSWSNGAVTASVTASVPADYPTTYAIRLGVTQAF